MFRQHVAIPCFLLIVLSVSLLGGCSQQKEITIGGILYLTTKDGKPLPSGLALLQGIEMAVDEVNADGGINGARLRFVYKDSHGDVETAKRDFEELAKQPPVVMLTVYTHVSEALAPLANKSKIPQLISLATGEDLTKDRPYSFRYWPKARDEALAILPVIKKLKIRKLGIISLKGPYGDSMASVLADVLKENGVKTCRLAYEKADSVLLKSLNAVKDEWGGIYLITFPNVIVDLAKVVRQAIGDKPLLGPTLLALPFLSAEPVFDKAYIAAPLIYNPSYPNGVDAGKRFLKRTGNSLDHHSAGGYDTIKLLAEIMSRSGDKREDLRKALDAGFVYPGLFGDVVKKEGDHDFTFPSYPARIVNKSLVYQDR